MSRFQQRNLITERAAAEAMIGSQIELDYAANEYHTVKDHKTEVKEEMKEEIKDEEVIRNFNSSIILKFSFDNTVFSVKCGRFYPLVHY